MTANVVPMWSQHPPGCDCGCGGGMSGAMDCWQQIAQFKAFLQQMLSELGPFPTKGVVDGSDASPGNIGEFFHASVDVAFAAYPTVTNANVTPVVVAPGDWDLWTSLNFSTFVGMSTFVVSPVPTGLSNNMAGGAGALSATGITENVLTVIGQQARGSFSVPTLLPFTVSIHQDFDAALLAGTATLMIEGRRRR